jgi:tetraacyldisaccharide 4'-kinase
MIRPPAFWTDDRWPAALLAPLGAATAALTARRVGRRGIGVPVPVFCCGNATMGGAGKTTVAIDLAERLLAAGRAVHFLSRGYGGAARDVLRVDGLVHDAGMVGDEPLLLASVAPCWVGRDRAAAAAAAIKAGAEVLVMDDGLQNPDLAGRHSALVIDGGAGFGNGRLFPAGPLREPVAVAAARCERAMLIGADEHRALAALPQGLCVLRGQLVARDAAWVAGQRVWGFAGIGRPEKFFASLVQAGAILVGRSGFADHQRYGAGTLARLMRRADAAGARLVTTPKDAVRLPPFVRRQVGVVGVGVTWEQPAAVDDWLAGPWR